MIASHIPTSAHFSALPDSHSLRVQGHMSDGVGATYGAEPCAVLSASAEELWLNGNRGDFRIPRSAVVRIGRGSLYPWFFRGVRIHHRVSGFPKELQFFPLAGCGRDIRAQLATLGFPTG